MANPGLTSAIESGAERAAELLRGIAAAAPAGTLGDQVFALLVLGRVLALLDDKEDERGARRKSAKRKPAATRRRASG